MTDSPSIRDLPTSRPSRSSPGRGDADEPRRRETRLADEDPGCQRPPGPRRSAPLITALAGLVTASAEYLGPHAGPVRDGLKTLQLAFREASAAPEEPGSGPGEKYTGPVW